MVGDDWELIHGDAITELPQLASDSVDALITDPPYSSGGAFRGDRTGSVASKYMQGGTKIARAEFGGDTRDQRSYLHWCAWWLSECYRILRPGAAVAVFSDWRQLPTLTDAFQMGGFTWRGVCVWDKGGGRPTMGRPFSQAEYIVWGSKGPMPTDREAQMIPGVLRVCLQQSDKHHVTGKPTEVMRWIVGLAESGSLILDPFAGSGTTGVAALLEGHRFIGIEREEAYAAIACDRLRKCSAQATLF